MGFKFISLFLLLLPLLTLTILSRADQALASDKKLHESHRNRTVLAGAGRVKIAALKGRKQTSECNLFQGRWVFDASYPFYDSSTCPFIDGEFDCLKFGRPDRQFLKYSWQPDSCTIPRFDGQAFLNKWRGKRVMFVGDSLSQNMWESLGCMIHASVPDTKTTFIKRTSVSSLIFQALASDKKLHESHRNRTVLAGAGRVKIAALKGRKQTRECNLFQGRWVFDASYPFYDSSTCPFIDGEFDCLKFGRPDRQFLKYSWQPDSCTIPRYRHTNVCGISRRDVVARLVRILGANCHAPGFDARRSGTAHPVIKCGTGCWALSPAQEYGVTIYLYRTPYLVDITKESVGRVLNLGTIEGGADVWKDMDILVFNSWHWWLHKGVELQGWDYIRNGSSLIRDMDRLDAFNKGLTTWAQWVDQNVNISQTRVFFQGISPTHYVGKEWNEPRNNCNGQLKPLSGSTYPGGSLAAASIVSRVLSSMKTPVYLLDITTLSQLRKDAHPSTYGAAGGSDCSHWCLPGLPDIWNQLLYAALSM
ncbi:hypothetical protein DY000_02035206 [Brassica cretica]|uniref:Trichome birefringence-like N-terminal domain-containing protein n=1 Tax=Brassica cretica TaxID=69181 RepID=A0ABQ7DE73_BRACR|nr:hypothetical protein DY000_02035206 [Brassica cretica]